jgi:hypothetical protein
MSFLLNVARRGAGLAPVATVTSSAVAPAQVTVPLAAAGERGDGGFVELDAEVIAAPRSASASPLTPTLPEVRGSHDVMAARDVVTPAEIDAPRNIGLPESAPFVAAAAGVSSTIRDLDDSPGPQLVRAPERPPSPQAATAVEDVRSSDHHVIPRAERAIASPQPIAAALPELTATPPEPTALSPQPKAAPGMEWKASATRPRFDGDARPGEVPVTQRHAAFSSDDAPAHPPARDEIAPQVAPNVAPYTAAETVGVGSAAPHAVLLVQPLPQRAGPLAKGTRHNDHATPALARRDDEGNTASATPAPRNANGATHERIVEQHVEPVPPQQKHRSTASAVPVVAPAATAVAPPAVAAVVVPAASPPVAHIPKPRATSAPRAIPVLLEGPAPRAMPAPRSQPADAPSAQREVHVHIGAIEVRATPPPKLAEPPPPAAPRRAEPGEHGFDAFAQLRSYAGWGR